MQYIDLKCNYLSKVASISTYSSCFSLINIGFIPPSSSKGNLCNKHSTWTGSIVLFVIFLLNDVLWLFIPSFWNFATCFDSKINWNLFIELFLISWFPTNPSSVICLLDMPCVWTFKLDLLWINKNEMYYILLVNRYFLILKRYA